MSLWSWSVTFKKHFGLRKAIKETKKFAPEFSRFLQEEQMDAAIKLAEKQKLSHVARVLGEALSEVKPCCVTARPSPPPTSTRPSGRWSARC